MADTVVYPKTNCLFLFATESLFVQVSSRYPVISTSYLLTFFSWHFNLQVGYLIFGRKYLCPLMVSLLQLHKYISVHDVLTPMSMCLCMSFHFLLPVHVIFQNQRQSMYVRKLSFINLPPLCFSGNYSLVCQTFICI